MSWRRRLLAWVAVKLLRLWLKTLRYQRLGPLLQGPGIAAFWHGDQLPLLGLLPSGKLSAPVSLSRDGRLQALILGRLGIGIIDGSSSRRGFSALRGLSRALSQDQLLLMAVDGPRGPRGRAQLGALYLARKRGVPLWPVGVAVSRGHRLRRAWDRFLLPLPFTRVIMEVGAPLLLNTETDLEEARGRLERALQRSCHRAQGRIRASSSGEAAEGQSPQAVDPSAGSAGGSQRG